jgi:beta-N-acetylhexosaminidase
MRPRLVYVLALVATASALFGAVALTTADDRSPVDQTAGRDPAAGASTTGTSPAKVTEIPECSETAAVADWDLRRRLSQLLMIGVTSFDEASQVVAVVEVGGLFVHGDDTAMLQSGLLEQLRQGRVVAPLIAADDEGGRVQRIDALYGSIPSAREVAATLSVEQVEAMGEQRGRQLAASGITMNLAPVVDISSQAGGSVIGDRAYSPDPAVTTAYAGAFAAGLRTAGIIPALKHFPGHGRSAGDSHAGPTTTPSLDSLRRADLAPYRELLDDGAAAVMVGHLDVPGLTEPGTPTSLSPATITGLLRGELGFDGVVMTDDLVGMRAVTDRYDLPDAVRRAISAGADMALWVTTERVAEVLDHLERSVGDGSLAESRVNEAVGRILRLKDITLCA